MLITPCGICRGAAGDDDKEPKPESPQDDLDTIDGDLMSEDEGRRRVAVARKCRANDAGI